MGFTEQLKQLDARRRALGMSHTVLAERSGVSQPTVQRILAAQHATPTFANVLAIANALGMRPRFGSELSVEEMREAQAKKKAERIVSMVQATSGLEGQGLGEETVTQMIVRTIHELMAGSSRNLWSS